MKRSIEEGSTTNSSDSAKKQKLNDEKSLSDNLVLYLLPNDIIYNILIFLSCCEYNLLKLVSKKFNSLILHLFDRGGHFTRHENNFSNLIFIPFDRAIIKIATFAGKNNYSSIID